MATFASRCREFRAVMRPTDVVLDESRKPTVIRGKTITFKNGRYETNDPEEIEFLMKHYARPAEFDVVPDAAIADRTRDVAIIEGAMSTAGAPNIGRVQEIVREASEEEITEKVMKAVDEKLTLFASQILDALKAPGYIPKKVFTCPVCKEPFPSGIAVGKHKKEAHPELTKPKE